jgi:hypothetical protein
MRLTSPGFLRPFRTVTFMGDEFRQSTLALAFENKYAVDWQPHPAFKPTRQRKTPLKDRVRLFYFATKDDRRGSVTHYAENKLIPKILKWFDDPANDPGQVLITSNRRFEHCFEKPKMKTHDEPTPSGVQRVLTPTNTIARLWAPPKLAGTDIYKDMSNVAFFAAMRPGGEETDFVGRSLLITEEEIIRWREYNALYQFVMRICPRKYDSDEIANIYVFDEYQAEYLRERFGGCGEFTHIDGVCSFTQTKGGRPAKNPKGATSPAERKRAQRERDRAAKKAERDAVKERADWARKGEGDVLDRLANMMRAEQERK